MTAPQSFDSFYIFSFCHFMSQQFLQLPATAIPCRSNRDTEDGYPSNQSFPRYAKMLENTEGEELYKIQGAEIHCGDKIDCGEHNIKQNDVATAAVDEV